MAEVCASSENLDQTPRSAASDLGLHGLPSTLLGVSRLQWVKMFLFLIAKLAILQTEHAASLESWQGNTELVCQRTC